MPTYDPKPLTELKFLVRERCAQMGVDDEKFIDSILEVVAVCFEAGQEYERDRQQSPQASETD